MQERENRFSAPTLYENNKMLLLDGCDGGEGGGGGKPEK